MPVPITGLFAALLTAVGLTLMVRVARMRARIAHPFGLSLDRVDHPLRAVGAVGSVLTMFVLAIVALWQAVAAV